MKRDGWERLSIRANTRPDRLPQRIFPNDLLYPETNRFVMFLLCGVGAFCLSLIFVLGPLALVVMYTPVESGKGWLWIAEGVGFLVFWAALFVAAVREDDELRRWLADQ